jgi:hypothetical protein
MKRPLLGLIACALLAGTATPIVVFADDDPAAYFDDQCMDCHQRKKKPIDDKHMSREKWKEAVDKMLQLEKLDPVPSQEFISRLLDWLAKTHGPADAAATPGATPTATPAAAPAAATPEPAPAGAGADKH